MAKAFHVDPTSGPGPKFCFRDDEHVPYNKLPYEANGSVVLLEVQDYNGERVNPEPWTNIHIEEVTKTKTGARSRVISVSLDREARAKLIEMLTRGEA